MTAVARLPLPSDPPASSRASKCPKPYLVLDLIVVDGHSPVVYIARQRYQTFKDAGCD